MEHLDEEYTTTDYISFAAATSSVLLYLTGWPAIFAVVRHRSTGETSVFPYVAMFTNCAVWILYAILKVNTVIFYVNCTGATLQITYIFIFYTYTKSKRLFNQQLIGSALFLSAVYTYAYMYTTVNNKLLVMDTLGSIGSFLAVLAYAAPLSAMGTVIANKSTASMNFTLSVANFIVGLEWSVYGKYLGDVYVMGPNILGVIVAIAQLSLFGLYPSRPKPALPT